MDIEEQLVEAVARRVVEILREEEVVVAPAPRILRAAQVAERYGVSPAWVYANATALGAIRMGSGPRARLRFDRDDVAERIARLAAKRSETRSPLRARRRGSRAVELLPVIGRGT